MPDLSKYSIYISNKIHFSRFTYLRERGWRFTVLGGRLLYIPNDSTDTEGANERQHVAHQLDAPGQRQGRPEGAQVAAP